MPKINTNSFDDTQKYTWCDSLNSSFVKDDICRDISTRIYYFEETRFHHKNHIRFFLFSKSQNK